jgi:hypothetical protein
VSDARKVAKMKSRVLDMHEWHDVVDGKCYVCMAGAVIDRTLRGNPRINIKPEGVAGWAYHLRAIDSMRCGNFHSALDMIGDPQFTQQEAYVIRKVRYIVQHGFDLRLRRAPWSTYLKAADILERAGL